MRSRALILRSHRVFATAVLLLHLGAAAQAAAAAETTGKKDLRNARTAVREGRLADGLEAYERILGSTTTDKQRFEPLYKTVLILLASDPNAATGETVRQRLATREEQLQGKIDELGQCTAEMKLVLDQLDGTHQNELQMLQVVIRKNEELAEQTKQLALKERTLADQAQQLALKEEEIHKREEVIREVTERVLGKDPTDS